MSCNNAACLDPTAAEYCALTSSQTSFGFGEVIERAVLDRDCCTTPERDCTTTAKALPYRSFSLAASFMGRPKGTSVLMQSNRPLPRRVVPIESSHCAKLSGPWRMMVLYERRSSSLSDMMGKSVHSRVEDAPASLRKRKME